MECNHLARTKECTAVSSDTRIKAGCPSAGVLHQIKRAAKSRYKYEVRRLTCRAQYIRREKMAAALASHNSNSFWHQVHCVNHSKRTSPVSAVDGVSGAQSISQLFFAKLHGILKSRDCFEHDSLLQGLASSLSSDDLALSSFSVECVVEAFSHLKSGKGDGISPSCGGSLDTCTPCFEWLSCLFVHSHFKTWVYAEIA